MRDEDLSFFMGSAISVGSDKLNGKLLVDLTKEIDESLTFHFNDSTSFNVVRRPAAAGSLRYPTSVQTSPQGIFSVMDSQGYVWSLGEKTVASDYVDYVGTGYRVGKDESDLDKFIPIVGSGDVEVKNDRLEYTGDYPKSLGSTFLTQYAVTDGSTAVGGQWTPIVLVYPDEPTAPTERPSDSGHITFRKDGVQSFYLNKGIYRFRFSTALHYCNLHYLRLYDVTNDQVVAESTMAWAQRHGSYWELHPIHFKGFVNVLEDGTEYQFQVFSQSTSGNLGYAYQFAQFSLWRIR